MAYPLVIANETIRQKAMKWLANAPIGYRIIFREPKRSGEQNDLMWMLLSFVASQKLHQGRKYAPEVWKCIFMNALGQETKFIPTLDGQSVFPISLRSSQLSKKEMTDLIEFIYAWGAENNVNFYVERAIAA
jgi:NinB protein